jgi:carbamate kinase
MSSGPVVAALGGNALLRRGESMDAATQRANIVRAAHAVAAVARRREVVVTHGNGPQVGLLALQAEAYRDVAPYPLDVLGAESEGMIGYVLEQELMNALPGRPVATLLTQVSIDAADPALAEPSKPIGPVYDEPAGRRLATERGWALAPDGDGMRRVVASPEPRAILELASIQLLIGAGVLVVCAGGGGIPVTITTEGAIQGVEAVVDKDRAAALLAEQLDADALLLLTDVPRVVAGWGTAAAVEIDRATPTQLRHLAFAAGSMGPKVEAACRFVERTGGRAAIGALDDAEAVLAGRAGTQIRVEPATAGDAVAGGP